MHMRTNYVFFDEKTGEIVGTGNFPAKVRQDQVGHKHFVTIDDMAGIEKYRVDLETMKLVLKNVQSDFEPLKALDAQVAIKDQAVELPIQQESIVVPATVDNYKGLAFWLAVILLVVVAIIAILFLPKMAHANSLNGQGNAVIVGVPVAGNCLQSSGGILISDSGQPCGGATPKALTPGTTVAWNVGTTPNATLSPAQSFTLSNPIGIVAGDSYNIQITQPASGGPDVITWGTAYTFPSGVDFLLSTAASTVDVVSCISFDGTTLRCNGLNSFAH